MLFRSLKCEDNHSENVNSKHSEQKIILIWVVGNDPSLCTHVSQLAPNKVRKAFRNEALWQKETVKKQKAFE